MPTPAAPKQCPMCGYPLRDAMCGACRGVVLDAPMGRPVRPGRGLAVLDAAHGFAAFWRATIGLLTRPEYFGKLAAPVCANAVGFALVALLALTVVHPAMSEVAQWRWVGALPWRAARDPGATATGLTIVATLLVGPSLLQIIALPFQGPLADAVEKMLVGPGARAIVASRWRGAVSSLRAAAQVLAAQLVLAIPCLLLSLWHAGLLVVLCVSAIANAVLWFEIPFARRGQGLDQRARIVWHNWARALGFGLALELGLLVPFVGLLLLAPAATVAVTTLYLRFEKVPRAGMVRASPTPASAAGAGASSRADDAS